MIALDADQEHAVPRRVVPPVRSRQSYALEERAWQPSVQPQHRQETRQRLGMLLSLVICAGIAGYLVSQYATIISLNYENQRLRVALTQQQADNASLEFSVNELSSPTRILQYAENVLKMRPSTPIVVGTSGH